MKLSEIDHDDSNILLMFSGGLDSTCALWNLLQDPKNKLHLHHLHLSNLEKRSAAENIAVNKILSYLSQNQYNTKYSESYHQYPSYLYFNKDTKVLYQRFMYDSDIYNFMAATICFCLPNIKKVAIGRTKSDDNTQVTERSERGNKLLKLFAPNVEKIYPIKHLTKREVYSILPKELRDMTWSCRNPVHISDDTYNECGKCATCLELNKIKNSQYEI